MKSSEFSTSAGQYSDMLRKKQLHETRQWSEWGIGKRALGSLAVAGAIGLTGFSQYWTHDVAPERTRLAETQPEIHEIYDARDKVNSNTAVIDFVGLGNLDATETAANLSSYDRIGNVWAVEYDNQGIDTKVIADIITAKAEEDDIKQIVLSGHSMGGDVALEVARHLYEKEKKDIELAAVILDCTPPNLDAVRPEERDRGEDMLRWIGQVPGARESRIVRGIVETVAREETFIEEGKAWHKSIDLEGLQETLVTVWTEKLNKSVASNKLIESQFKVIASSGAMTNLGVIAEANDEWEPPAIFYIRPRDARKDRVVDVQLAQGMMVDVVGGPEGTLHVIKVDGTGHANPSQQPDRYNEAIERRIAPVIEARQREAHIQTLAQAILPVVGIIDTDE